MCLMERSIVGCFPEFIFQFSVVQVLVGLPKQFIKNFVFPLGRVLLVLIIIITIIIIIIIGRGWMIFHFRLLTSIFLIEFHRVFFPSLI